MLLSLLVRLLLKRSRLLPLAQPTPPGLLLSVLLAQVPLAQLRPPGMALTFPQAQLPLALGRRDPSQRRRAIAVSAVNLRAVDNASTRLALADLCQVPPNRQKPLS